MFSFPLIQGNPNTALNDTQSVVITENMAMRLFGEGDPMNKIMKVDSMNFTVSGILKDLPPIHDSSFDFLVNWDMAKRLGWDDDLWDNDSSETFVLLKPEVNPVALTRKSKPSARRILRGRKGRSVPPSIKEMAFVFPVRKWDRLPAERSNLFVCSS